MKLSLKNIRVAKFQDLREICKKQRAYFTLKISQYTVYSYVAAVAIQKIKLVQPTTRC